MEMFKNIRLKRGRYILRKKKSRTKRTRFTGNINNAKTIGIVWDATKPDYFDSLTQFYQKMQERKVDVKILGYFPGKELPDKYTAIRYLTFIKKQDISFLYRPVSPDASSFIKTPFDILIDINFKKLFPLHYISSLSVAGLKVGLFDSNSGDLPFDLMIELNNSKEINTYLTQIVHYLEIINIETNKQSVNKF
jgi:hypothetical protein